MGGERRAGKTPSLRDEQGISVLEILVASAVLVIIAYQISLGLGSNMEARQRVELSREYLAIEQALRGAAFLKMSALVEGPLDCRKPAAAVRRVWRDQAFQGVRFRLLEKAQADRHPAEVVRRCRNQTHRGSAQRGFYFCLSANAGGDTAARSFLDRNDVYAEVFFGLWDAAADRSTTCAAFHDSLTPVRAAKLHYVIYWRPKASPKDAPFLQQTGLMYGQTKKR